MKQKELKERKIGGKMIRNAGFEETPPTTPKKQTTGFDDNLE